MEKLLLKLSYEEIEIFLEELKDALNRGYSLGYVDAITTSQGRLLSSNSDMAIKYHIEQFKDRFNIKEKRV